MNTCIYCNSEATHQFSNGKWCCSVSMNGCPEIKRKRSEDTKKSWQNATRGQRPKVERKQRNHFLSIEEQEFIIKEFQRGVSVNHLREATGRGQTILKRLLKKSGVVYDKEKIKANKERIAKETPNLFVKNSQASNATIKKIIESHNLIPHTECWECGLSEWLKGKLTLELDHIDGDNRNNEICNLRYLCPNCHSQTETFRGRNINTGKIKVSDENLLKSLQKCNNIRQALIDVNLTPGGENYTRANNIKKRQYINL